MTFGYLNLGNPKIIGDTESQEANNVSIESGFLEYKAYATNDLNNRKLTLPNGKITMLDKIQGQVKWKDSESGTLTAIGLDKPSAIVVDPSDPTTTISKVPTVATAAYGSNPYAAGTYIYGLTLYDPDTGEESTVSEFTLTTVDHSVPGNEVVQFTNFPDVSTYFPARTNLQWRIYRMPLGGSEFLLVNTSTTISANAVYAGPYQDIIADEDLGIANDSYYDLPILRWSERFNAIAVFNDHLFVGGTSASTGIYKIYFSRQGKWWAFPPENELNLDADKLTSQNFKGFCNLAETLLIFGGNKSAVLYGDNADNFALKDIDFDISSNGEESWFSQNTMREANNMAVFSLDGYEDIVVEGTTQQIVACKRLAAFDGAKAKVISTKIKSLFDLPLDNEDSFAESSVLENRFYCVKYVDLEATLDQGIPIASITASDYIYKTLVFDSYAFGWLTADSSGTFTYRTKEYSLPRQVLFHKRIWVEAEGDFVLQFLGDGNVVSSITLSLDSKQQLYLNIRPYRYQTFSFKFIGQSDCKIYDFGVDE